MKDKIENENKLKELFFNKSIEQIKNNKIKEENHLMKIKK
jgi:hypothetical protein